MSSSGIGRRGIVGAGLGAAGMLSFGRRASARLPMPKSPVALNAIDVAGSLALTQTALENYRKLKPNLVSRIAVTKGPAPELPGKIKAQQNAKRVDIDLVMGGYDQLAAGADQDLWIRLLPDYADALPDLDGILLDGARKIQALTHGQGVCVNYSPYGPLLEYMPDRVKQVPGTAEELLAWCRQNKGRFIYGRPGNSGPGRAFMAGLPYILGDADPKDPIRGWDKSWAYLKALGETIEYYPSGTAAVFKEFGDGTRDMTPTTTGWDINPRALGIVPKEAKVAAIKGFHWGIDAHCICVPKGVGEDKLAVILDLIGFILTPEQQAYSFGDGYFYPGPAVKGVTIDMAPPDSRAVIAEFGRPEYERLMADHPLETPLSPAQTVQAFRRWDEEIGGAKRK